nr:PREDICTED: trypsin alpha-like [Fopius arisanus]
MMRLWTIKPRNIQIISFHSADLVDCKPVGIMKLLLAFVTLFICSNNGVDARSPSKIVGGKRVDISEAPFTVMIRHIKSINLSNSAICGGTIIAKKYILTAAHCFPPNAKDPLQHPRWYRIIPGQNFYYSNAKSYKIQEVYSHPNFSVDITNDVKERADIAVIQLQEAMAFDDQHMAIRLATQKPLDSAHGIIFGWGFSDPNVRALSHTLQGLPVIAPGRQTCKKNFPTEQYANDELCIVNINGGSLCDGDSGGPLIADGVLAGVISSGHKNCLNSTPGVVIDVAYHRPWIKNVIKGTAQAFKHFASFSNQVLNSRPTKKPKKPYTRDELSSWPLLITQSNEIN